MSRRKPHRTALMGTRRAAPLFATAIGALAASPALAQADGQPPGGILAGFSGGVLAHGVTIISRTDHEEGEVAVNGEIDFAPFAHVLGGSFYPEVGGSVASGGGTSYGYADVRYEYTLPNGIFLGAGLGGAVQNGTLQATSPDHNALGSRVLFHLPVEVGFAFAEHYRASIYFEHISNGYLAKPNEGVDNIGVRLGYRF
jgi:lipid A 3-O-deacylase